MNPTVNGNIPDVPYISRPACLPRGSAEDHVGRKDEGSPARRRVDVRFKDPCVVDIPVGLLLDILRQAEVDPATIQRLEISYRLADFLRLLNGLLAVRPTLYRYIRAYSTYGITYASLNGTYQSVIYMF